MQRKKFPVKIKYLGLFKIITFQPRRYSYACNIPRLANTLFLQKLFYQSVREMNI